jgi:hypothetical protein
MSDLVDLLALTAASTNSADDVVPPVLQRVPPTGRKGAPGH